MSLRRKTRASLSGPGSSNTSTTPATSRKRSKNSGPTRKWAKVLRYPAPTVPFKVLKWVPVEELTDEEKKEWKDEQQKISGSFVLGSTKDDEMELSENDQNVEGNIVETKTLNDSDAEIMERIDASHKEKDEEDGII